MVPSFLTTIVENTAILFQILGKFFENEGIHQVSLDDANYNESDLIAIVLNPFYHQIETKLYEALEVSKLSLFLLLGVCQAVDVEIVLLSFASTNQNLQKKIL